MNWPIYLLIICWAMFGILGLIWPKKMKVWSKTLTNTLPYWLWSLVCFALAYFIWQSQFFFLYPLVIQITAVLTGIKGLLFLVISRKNLNKLLDFWMNLPDKFYRVFGILLLILALLFYKGLV